VNTQLDALAYGNRLRTLPPKQKLFFALVLLVIAMFVHPPIQLAIGLWMLVWTVFYAGIPWRFYLGMVLGVMSFLLTSLVATVGWSDLCEYECLTTGDRDFFSFFS
jgi:cobalt/nickel transport system permease protein